MLTKFYEAICGYQATMSSEVKGQNPASVDEMDANRQR